MSYARNIANPTLPILIAVPFIAAAISFIPAQRTTLASKPSTPYQQAQQESLTYLLSKTQQQCKQALADHNSALSVCIERDPVRKEHKLKQIVLQKNREWKAQASGADKALEFFFKSTPFMVYKKSIDQHIRILNRAKKKIMKKSTEKNLPIIATIDDTITQLKRVNEYIVEHDHYLREHASSGGKGSMIISLLTKCIPSPLKLLA